MTMDLSPAQIVALVAAQPADDGRYHLTQKAGVTAPTMRVIVRLGLAELVTYTERPERYADITKPNADWEVVLTKSGLQHRDVWRRYLTDAEREVERQLHVLSA
jgi:hypothetical protein